MKTTCPVLFLLLLAPLLGDADVSGKWTGSLEFKGPDGEAQAVPAYAQLKQEGHSILGTVWKDAKDRFVIENGKIEGDGITFEFKAPEGEDEAILVHTVRLTLVTQVQLEGSLEFEAGGRKMSGKLRFTRDK